MLRWWGCWAIAALRTSASGRPPEGGVAVPFASRGGSLYIAHQRHLEAMAQRAGSAALSALGLQGLP